jgi:hypothetical protein
MLGIHKVSVIIDAERYDLHSSESLSTRCVSCHKSIAQQLPALRDWFMFTRHHSTSLSCVDLGIELFLTSLAIERSSSICSWLT